ncbi:MAG: hypothetical protein PVG66_13780 [Chromatiales bacterium]
MLKLFNFFVDLCLLRRAPQDLPASSSLFALTVLLNVLISTVGVMDLMPGPAMALAAAVVDALLLIVVLRLLLMMQNHVGRFLQTATALFGSGALLNLIALPLQLVTGDNNSEAGAGQPMISLAYLLLIIWIQVVIGHILRHALEIKLSLAIGLALTYSILAGMLIKYLFLAPAS